MIIQGVKKSTGKTAYVLNHPKSKKQNVQFTEHKVNAYNFAHMNECKAIRDDALEFFVVGSCVIQK